MSESMQEQIAAAILARRLAEGDVQVEAYNDGLNDAAAVARAFEPAGETVTLAVTDVEALSAQVHEAWMATKREQGITTRPSEWGEEQMVPYVELSERAKDLDRSTVQAVLDAQTVLAAVPLSEHPTVDEQECDHDWMRCPDCTPCDAILDSTYPCVLRPGHPGEHSAAPPAPHGDGSWVCGRCGEAPEIHASRSSRCIYDPVFKPVSAAPPTATTLVTKAMVERAAKALCVKADCTPGFWRSFVPEAETALLEQVHHRQGGDEA